MTIFPERVLPFLLPGQRPGEWQPTTPIDLLPALAQAYPRCIKPSVLAVQLVNVAAPSATLWHFRVVTVRQEQLVPAWPITQDDDDLYDYSDWPAHEFPVEVLRLVFESRRLEMIQHELDIFEPDSFALMQRLVDDQQRESQADLGDTRDTTREQLVHWRYLALDMAQHLVNAADVSEQVRAALCGEPAMDDGAAVSSRWLEVGKAVATESLWVAQFAEDVAHEVRHQVALLPRAVQLAHWLVDKDDDGLLSPSELLDWWPPASSDEKLSGEVRGLFREQARLIMQDAAEDYRCTVE